MGVRQAYVAQGVFVVTCVRFGGEQRVGPFLPYSLYAPAGKISINVVMDLQQFHLVRRISALTWRLASEKSAVLNGWCTRASKT